MTVPQTRFAESFKFAAWRAVEARRGNEFGAALWKDTDDRKEESLQLWTAMNPNPGNRMRV